MARIKLPHDHEIADLLNLLAYGYIIEVERGSQMTLFLKLEPATLNAVLAGCKISLVFMVENGYPVLWLKIYDKPNQPLWFCDYVWKRKMSYLDYLNHIVFNLKSEGKQITISLFDMMPLPILAYDTTFEFEIEQWRSWSAKYLKLGQSHPDDDFEIPLLPVNNAGTEKVVSIVNYYDDNGSVVNKHVFDYNKFFESGNHGYAQEHSIKNILINYFEIDSTLFVSPYYKFVDEEFTDFVVLLPHSVLLIESKCAIGNSKINQRLGKAAHQLDKARRAIESVNEFLKNANLESEIRERAHVYRLCVFNSDIDINKHKKYLHGLTDVTLPIYMPTSIFYRLLVNSYLEDKNNQSKLLEDFFLSNGSDICALQ